MISLRYFFITGLLIMSTGFSEASSNCTQAPSFKLRDQSGNFVTLQEILDASKNKIILLSIFQTTCAPCIAEINDLINLKKKYEDLGKKSFDLILIDSKEDRKASFDFLRKHNFNNLMTLNDPNGKLDSLYNIKAIPQLIMINKNGNLQASKKGTEIFHLRESNGLDKYIQGLLDSGSCEVIKPKS